MKKVKFSIVTVVYNGAESIEKTIISVINQIYTCFEYIIIDGESTDNTLEVCYLYKNKITKIISEPDKGIYDAMNKGLDLCSGDYVLFLNSGDLFPDKDTLKQVYNNVDFEILPDMIYGNAFEKEPDSDLLLEKKARNYKWKWFGMFAHHQSIFYYIPKLRHYRIRYNLKYKLSSDWDFTLRFISVAERIIYINQPICIFGRGGFSSNYLLGLKEQFNIRRDTLLYPIYVCAFIYLIQFILIKLRFIFPSMYNFFRFTKK